jgi:hypothetical protein
MDLEVEMGVEILMVMEMGRQGLHDVLLSK